MQPILKYNWGNAICNKNFEKRKFLCVNKRKKQFNCCFKYVISKYFIVNIEIKYVNINIVKINCISIEELKL